MQQTINLTILSSEQLAALISSAAKVLAARATETKSVVVQTKEVTKGVVIAPNATDRASIVYLLTQTKAGDLVRAAEKDEYEALARKYSEYFEHKKYPNSLRGRHAETFVKRGRI